MSDYIEFLKEVFELLGSVNARKMFGGYGLYHNGLMIGLVERDTLYLKVDEVSNSQFIDRELLQFEYEKAGKRIKMSYYAAPDEIYDDPEQALIWGRLAYQAAVRANAKKHNHT